MTAAMTHFYVLRPRAELVARAPADAWFARPSLWELDRTLGWGADTASETNLKLGFLAELYEAAHREVEYVSEHEERAKREARELLSWAPLTLASFDRLWSLEPLGVGQGLWYPERVSSPSLAAVSEIAQSEAPTVAANWRAMLERRPLQRAAALAALRFVVPRLFAAFPTELTPPRCMVHGMADIPPRAELIAALSADGWSVEGRSTLSVYLQRVDVPDDAASASVAASFTVLSWHGERPSRRVLRRGEVGVVVQQGTGQWTVADASLSTSETRSLMP